MTYREKRGKEKRKKEQKRRKIEKGKMIENGRRKSYNEVFIKSYMRLQSYNEVGIKSYMRFTFQNHLIFWGVFQNGNFLPGKKHFTPGKNQEK